MTKVEGVATTKRKPDTGLIRPYRDRPADFDAVFIRMGWDGIDEHYRTNWRCIRRWVDAGGVALTEARRDRTGYGQRKAIRRGTAADVDQPTIKTGREIAAAVKTDKQEG